MRNPLVATLLRWGVPLVATYAIVLALINVGVIDDFMMATVATICINIVLAVSLNLITGFTGQFSLGHAGFMAIGAYATGLVSIAMPTVPGFLLGLLVGGLVSALVGFLIGIPTLRLRGDYLAIATLGMAEIIRVVFTNLDITNGAAGLSGIPQFIDWNWLFLLTAGSVILMRNYIRSRQGRDAVAVREDEIAAESIGVDTTRAKVTSFTVGAFFAGIGGGMYASYFFFIKPDTFNFMLSINILVIVVLGGLGSITGSIIAAIVLAIIAALLTAFPAVQMIIYAAALVLIMIFRPEGLMGSRELSWRVLGRFRPAKADAVVETEKEGVR